MLGSHGKTVMLVEAAPLEEGPINGEVAEDVSTRSISKPVEKRDDHYLWKVVGRGRRKRSRQIEKPAAHWQIEALRVSVLLPPAMPMAPCAKNGAVATNIISLLFIGESAGRNSCSIRSRIQNMHHHENEYQDGREEKKQSKVDRANIFTRHQWEKRQKRYQETSRNKSNNT